MVVWGWVALVVCLCDMQNQIDTRNMVVVGGNVAQRGSSLIFGWRRFFSDVDRTTFADAQVVAGPEAWNLRVIGQTRLSSSKYVAHVAHVQQPDSPNTHALMRRVVDSVGAIIADINNEGSNLTLHFWETLSERVLGDAQFSIGQNNVMRLGLRRQAKTTVMSSHLKVPQRVMQAAALYWARAAADQFISSLPMWSTWAIGHSRFRHWN